MVLWRHSPFMAGLGALSAGASCALFSKDSLCTAVGVAILGAFVGGLTERTIINRTLASRRPRALVRVGVVLILGFFLGLIFRLNQPAAFEKAFGISLPPDVRDLKAERHYQGGSDHLTLIRFAADETTVQRILGAKQFVEDTEWRQYFSPQQDWSKILDRVFSNFAVIHGGREWELVPMNDPKIYMWKSPTRAMEEVRVLWNPNSGQVYAMHLD